MVIIQSSNLVCLKTGGPQQSNLTITVTQFVDDNITQLGIITNGAGSPNYPVCSSTVIGCTYDIPTGIYNMYVYDIEEEDTLSDD